MPFPNTPYRTDTPTPRPAIQLTTWAPWFPFCVRLRLQCDTGPAFPRPAILQIQWVWRFKSQDRSMRKTSSWGAGPTGAFLLDLVPFRNLGSASSLALAALRPGTWVWVLGQRLSLLRIRLPAPGLLGSGALQRPDPGLLPRETLPVPYR